MVTTDALKLLYKKLGGTADVDDITAISDMVDLIEDVAGGGGGGASGLVVNVVDVTLDKTYSDIKTAIESGIFPVVLKGDGDGGYEVYAIKTFSEGGGEYYVELPFALYVANSPTGVLTEEE